MTVNELFRNWIYDNFSTQKEFSDKYGFNDRTLSKWCVDGRPRKAAREKIEEITNGKIKEEFWDDVDDFIIEPVKESPSFNPIKVEFFDIELIPGTCEDCYFNDVCSPESFFISYVTKLECSSGTMYRLAGKWIQATSENIEFEDKVRRKETNQIYTFVDKFENSNRFKDRMVIRDKNNEEFMVSCEQFEVFKK